MPLLGGFAAPSGQRGMRGGDCRAGIGWTEVRNFTQLVAIGWIVHDETVLTGTHFRRSMLGLEERRVFQRSMQGGVHFGSGFMVKLVGAACAALAKIVVSVQSIGGHDIFHQRRPARDVCLQVGSQRFRCGLLLRHWAPS